MVGFFIFLMRNQFNIRGDAGRVVEEPTITAGIGEMLKKEKCLI
jgi:hypothetical protein